MMKLFSLYKRLKTNLSAIPSALTANVYARWCVNNNFGDALNPLLIELICGKPPVDARTTRAVKMIQEIRRKPDFMVIGSILQWCGKNSIVWGPGFISDSADIPCPPRKILAVRGPLTRKKLILQGIDCPEVFGDPALLLPKFFRPNVDKRYSLGVIPHYVDSSHPFINRIQNTPDVLFIDVQQDPKKVISEILSCERVASSSLHGLIVADAYRIPSLWLKFSDGVWGNGFKFHDYFLSTGSGVREMLEINENSTVNDLLEKSKLYPMNIDLDKLWKVCPLPHIRCR